MDRQTKIDRWTGRQTKDRWTDRQTERQMGMHKDTDLQTEMQAVLFVIVGYIHPILVFAIKAKKCLLSAAPFGSPF